MGTMDVPGVKEEDIDIKLDDGQLTVQGQRTIGSETSRFSSKFFRSFSLDPTVDVDSLAANLKNGVLTISAPKDPKRLEKNVRRIPITTLEDGKEDKEVIDVDEDSKNDTKPSGEEKEGVIDAPANSVQNKTKNDSPGDGSNDKK